MHPKVFYVSDVTHSYISHFASHDKLNTICKQRQNQRRAFPGTELLVKSLIFTFIVI